MLEVGERTKKLLIAIAVGLEDRSQDWIVTSACARCYISSA